MGGGGGGGFDMGGAVKGGIGGSLVGMGGAGALLGGSRNNGGFLGQIGTGIANIPGSILPGIFGDPYKQTVNSAGERPEMPGYKSILNGEGKLSDQYRLQGPGNIGARTLDTNAFAANQDALNAIKSRAMSQGDSPWLKMEMQRQALDNMARGDRLGAQNLSQQAQAQSQLAMNGGLSSGARERLAMQGARDLSAARQGLGRDAQMNSLNARLADDQTKMGLLSQVPGMDLGFANQRAGLEQFNLGQLQDTDKFNTSMAQDTNKFNMQNQIGGVQGENQFNAYKYGEAMKGFGAAKQGDAIANAGKK